MLAFFAFAHQQVTYNLVENFYQEMQVPAARAFFAVQIAMETIHQQTYLLLLQVLVTDPRERQALIEGVPTWRGSVPNWSGPSYGAPRRPLLPSGRLLLFSSRASSSPPPFVRCSGSAQCTLASSTASPYRTNSSAVRRECTVNSASYFIPR